jgi:K(+)-stimulated pyrophosphate-energized sodium pump
MDKLLYLVPVMGAIGLLYTWLKFNWVSKQDAGNDRMKEISTYIAEGAMAFLRAEWKILGYFVVIVSLLLAVMASANPHGHWAISIAFILGAVFSATAGYIGMKVATKANVRTAHAARTSLRKALEVSFTGGSVMGMGVAGLAVLGLGSLFIILRMVFADGMSVNSAEMLMAIEVLTGFSLGAESIALFARVGGGIYTKAADVGADLVEK